MSLSKQVGTHLRALCKLRKLIAQVARFINIKPVSKTWMIMTFDLLPLLWLMIWHLCFYFTLLI